MRKFIVLFAGSVLAIMPTIGRTDSEKVPPAFSPETTVITYERGGCLGTCPAYKVEIHGDGSVSFEGEAHTAKKGACIIR